MLLYLDLLSLLSFLEQYLFPEVSGASPSGSLSTSATLGAGGYFMKVAPPRSCLPSLHSLHHGDCKASNIVWGLAY